MNESTGKRNKVFIIISFFKLYLLPERGAKLFMPKEIRKTKKKYYSELNLRITLQNLYVLKILLTALYTECYITVPMNQTENRILFSSYVQKRKLNSLYFVCEL